MFIVRSSLSCRHRQQFQLIPATACMAQTCFRVQDLIFFIIVVDIAVPIIEVGVVVVVVGGGVVVVMASTTAHANATLHLPGADDS